MFRLLFKERVLQRQCLNVQASSALWGRSWLKWKNAYSKSAELCACCGYMSQMFRSTSDLVMTPLSEPNEFRRKGFLLGSSLSL